MSPFIVLNPKSLLGYLLKKTYIIAYGMLKPAKIRDRKAPRFRWSKYRFSVLNHELFKRFKEKFPDSSIKDWKTFSSIIIDYNKSITREVVDNRDGVRLPGHMGILAIASFRPTRLVPKKWLAIDQTGSQIKDLNIATDGLVCKIVYSVYQAKYSISRRHMWKFKGDRNFKTLVSKAFIANYNKYKQLRGKDTVSKIFDDDYLRVSVQRERNEQRSKFRQQNSGSLDL